MMNSTHSWSVARIALALALLFIVSHARGQLDTITLLDRAHAEASRMCSAFMKADYDAFLDLTHPVILRMGGGREAMKAMFEQGLPDGNRILDTRVERPKVLHASGDTVQCALQQRQKMLMDGKRYGILSDLIGISYDAGRSWVFIGVSGRSLRDVRKVFPEVDPELNVWPQGPPVLLD